MAGTKGAPHGHSAGRAASGKLTGGHWVTIRGHPAYIKDGKVVAGGIHGVTHGDDMKPSHGPDVDHHRMAAKVAHAAEKSAKKTGHPPDYRYEHGPATTPADRKHARVARESGAVAIHVRVTPRESVVPGGSKHFPVGGTAGAIGRERPGSKHRLVGGKPVATTYPDSNHHVVVLHGTDGTGKNFNDVYKHRTAEGAERRAAHWAGRVAARDVSVKRQAIRDVEKYDPDSHGIDGPHHVTTFRVIH